MIGNSPASNDPLFVPKEQFLVDYFNKAKSQAVPKDQKPFNEVLQSVQIKIEKKQLEALQNMPESESIQLIDKMSAKQAVELLKESIETLKTITG